MKFVIVIAGILFTSTSFSQSNCSFTLDTTGILENKNLHSLITKLKRSKLHESKNRNDIPKRIKEQLDCLVGEFSIASSDEEFQDNCIVEKPLPHRQIIYLGVSDNFLVLSYKSGGDGICGHILLISYNEQSILDLWSGVNLDFPGSKKTIIKHLVDNLKSDGLLNTGMIQL